MKRVNIQLDEELHRRAKILAVLQGTTLNDYLAAAVRKAVERDNNTLKKLE